MPSGTALTREQRAAYATLGYHYPVRAFSNAEAAEVRGKFLGYCAEHRNDTAPLLPRERVQYFAETQLFLRWAYDLVSDPRVLDAVESVLGPNVMVWSSQWFPKFPGDGSYVSWHQDAAYWGLSPPNVVTAWIAVTESNRTNGCMCVIGGTHLAALPQNETYAARNMLSRGQEIAVAVDELERVALELNPGEFSLHHVGIAHGSGPNESDVPRIGLAVRYVSPDVMQQGSERDMVLLVRGRDDYGHFDVVEPPGHDYAYGQHKIHADALARRRRNLLADKQ